MSRLGIVLEKNEDNKRICYIKHLDVQRGVLPNNLSIKNIIGHTFYPIKFGNGRAYVLTGEISINDIPKLFNKLSPNKLPEEITEVSICGACGDDPNYNFNYIKLRTPKEAIAWLRGEAIRNPIPQRENDVFGNFSTGESVFRT